MIQIVTDNKIDNQHRLCRLTSIKKLIEKQINGLKKAKELTRKK